MCRRTQQAGGVRAAVEPWQASCDGPRDERRVPNHREMLDDGPEVLLARRPADWIEPHERDRARVRAERPLAGEVVVVVEVAHDELADRAEDRRAGPPAPATRPRAPRPPGPPPRE